MIVFRCDANATFGFGHLMRCRQLSEELRRRGHRTAVYGDLPDNANDGDPPPFDRVQRAAPWSGSRRDAQAFAAYANSAGADALVVDHPGADGGYQTLLKSQGWHWLHFVGSAGEPLMADLVFCANAAADREAFEHMDRSSGTELLIGPEFALLRAQFRGLAKRRTRDRVEHVFVSFGGGSDRNAFRACLPVLLSEASPDCRFTLVAGRGNPDLAWIEAFAAARQDRVDLRIDETRIADLMMAADLAVMASGTTTLEAAACGLPMILLAIAANQIEPARAWQKRGAALHIGDIDTLAPDKLAGAFRKMQSAELRERQTLALYDAGVDGRGVARVADAIERRLLPPRREVRKQPI